METAIHLALLSAGLKGGWPGGHPEHCWCWLRIAYGILPEFTRYPILNVIIDCHLPMSRPLDITVDQAREVVIAEGERRGRIPQHLLESVHPEFQRILSRIREGLGSTVEL